MASLFANALRTQARVALVASRARVVPKTVSLFGLAARSSTPSFARSLSSSRVVLAEYGYGAERTPSPPTKTLFVGNLPYSADEGELEDVLSQFGTPQTIRFGRRPDGTAKGFAHVEFANVAAATKIFEASQNEPIMIANRSLRIDYAPERAPRVETQPYHKLYVYDFQGDENALQGSFEQFSHNITSVHLMRDADGNSLRAGFVEFTSVDQATEALRALNGQEPEYGSKLNLSYARPKRPVEQRGGGGYSGGGGGYSGGGGGRRGGGGGGGRY